VVQSRWNPIADSYNNYDSCAGLDDNDTEYSLSAGDVIIIPLFRDTST
jgi:hypothetical protein